MNCQLLGYKPAKRLGESQTETVTPLVIALAQRGGPAGHKTNSRQQTHSHH
jgi:hypothetical protein